MLSLSLSLRCVFLMSPSITRGKNAGGHVGFKQQRKQTGPRFIILILVLPCSIEIVFFIFHSFVKVRRLPF